MDNNNIDLNKVNDVDGIKILWTFLSRAQSKGCFTIDESVIIKDVFVKISKTVLENSKESKKNTTNNV
jgi:hypothetical protein